ncbi:MAG: hypothetical protein HC837_02400, partial [Chloroflexaceae bacterium]|nr:hypothetical protein [Chloroflexaceae bacterium]
MDMTRYQTPAHINQLAMQIRAAIEQQAIPAADHAALGQALDTFTQCWQTRFSRFGQHPAGELAYRDAFHAFEEQAAPLLRRWLPPDSPGRAALAAIEAMF